LQGDAVSALKVWPLALNGQRRGELSRSAAEGGLLLKLDTSRLPDGPALLFEMAEAWRAAAGPRRPRRAKN
jgi:hypothetical protein